LFQQVAVIREFALHYVDAQKDSVKATTRRLAIKTILGAAAAIIGVTGLITCTIMVTDALADLVSLAAGNRQWVGQLVVGGGILLVFAMVAAVYVARWTSKARAQTIRKYESRHNAQREQLGTDITRHAGR
jgi:hypothetical protein